jgi:PAS domain-containing protein
LEVNKKAAEMIGYTREELAAMTIMDLDPWVTEESWGPIWQQLLDKGVDHF